MDSRNNAAAVSGAFYLREPSQQRSPWSFRFAQLSVEAVTVLEQFRLAFGEITAFYALSVKSDYVCSTDVSNLLHPPHPSFTLL
jgi:hypothetical protein